MTRYTWTLAYAEQTRTYRDAAREIVAVLSPSPRGGWAWAVDQWGSNLAGGDAAYLADARQEAEIWIAALREVTPV
jgi:hypothetical protein